MPGRGAGRRLNTTTIRMVSVIVIFVLAWVGLGYRLFQVQVVKADELRELGDRQRMVERTLPPQRGTIFDRNGDLLATTVDAQSIYAVPNEVKDPVLTAQQVGIITAQPWEPILERLQSGGNFVYLARQVEPEIATQVMDIGLAGVFTETEASREYPAGDSAAQVVGYVDIDGNGNEGLEYQYGCNQDDGERDDCDDVLRGTPGSILYERDRLGNPIPQGRREEVPPVPGLDLVTSIDLPLQYSAQESCRAARERTEATACWIVVLDVESGEVLALAGAPAFNPETRLDAEGNPFSNFVVRGQYEPGSIQKMVTVSAALDSDVVEANTVIPSVASRIEINPGACASGTDDIYGCYSDAAPHPTESMRVSEVIARSSNVGTIKIGQRLEPETLYEYLERFGFGTTTGIDLSGEAAGAYNDDASCEVCIASMSIGYTVAATPLQMATAYAAIGNDGVWTQPHIVTDKVDADGSIVEVQPETRRVVSEETAATVRELLAGVVESGTASNAKVSGYRVGGKTGTANKIDENGNYTNETTASFVGLAPIDDPKVVVGVVVDEPKTKARFGATAAAPVFSEVMEQALHRMGVTPDG
ncbi:MAG: hypothetical protein GEU79_14210 [Acidimicrobiia bacterium]|nr:hypothetical protein [Acidimicrobiia bacterium]